MARLCQRCLSSNPHDRPTAAEIAQTLAGVLAPANYPFGQHSLRAAAVIVGCIGLGTAAIVLTGPPGSGVRTAPTPSTTHPRVTAGSADAPILIPSAPSASVPRSGASSSGAARPTVSSSLTVPQARDAARSVLDRGLAARTVRSDVAADIKQQINNLADNPIPSAAQRSQYFTELRNHITRRAQEPGAMSASLLAELNAALGDLATALEAASSPPSPSA